MVSVLLHLQEGQHFSFFIVLVELLRSKKKDVGKHLCIHYYLFVWLVGDTSG